MVTIVAVSIVGVTVIAATLWLAGKGGTVKAVAGKTGKHAASAKRRTVPDSEHAARWAIGIMSPVAICTLTLSYLELVPLYLSLIFLVIPAYTAMTIIGILVPFVGKRALIGFTAGFLATLMYDGARLLIAYAHDGYDPIGHIGEHLFGEGTSPTVGYLWRFYGNGAGLGILFAMLPNWWHNVRGGFIYGTIIAVGMAGTLALSDVAQSHLFVLTPGVLVDGTLGHWAYGLSLGFLVLMARRKLLKEET
ncbi:hypothetical protein [Streptomyces sp. NPDC002855]|uniref:hypothetical protein n=1 Tax=Streptomyces sp. NPDC002855 TaxID=3154437 RepID=UPI00332AC195